MGAEVLAELATSLKTPGPDGRAPSRQELAVRVGEFKSLIKAAERGELDPGGWKPVVRHPELWELRWTWEHARPDSMWRGYFHEPGVRPTQTVLALIHHKDVSTGHSEQIREAQNARMKQAADRVTAGRSSSWGLDDTPPPVP